MINKTKQHLIRTLCFATMLTTLASCADDEGTETSNNEKVYTSFVAGSDSITRTQLTESNKVEWEAGDEISLFDPSDNNRFSTSQSGTSVSFTGMANENSSAFYALYPYDEKATISGTTITTSLNPAQTTRTGSFAQGLNPSVATTTNRELTFKNACAVIKFNISVPLKWDELNN